MRKQLGIEETQKGEEWAEGDKSREGTEEIEEKYIIGEGETQHRNYKNGRRKKKKKRPYTETKLEEYYKNARKEQQSEVEESREEIEEEQEIVDPREEYLEQTYDTAKVYI